MKILHREKSEIHIFCASAVKRLQDQDAQLPQVGQIDSSYMIYPISNIRLALSKRGVKFGSYRGVSRHAVAVEAAHIPCMLLSSGARPERDAVPRHRSASWWTFANPKGES